MVGLGHALDRKTVTEQRPRVHGPLESVILPSEEIVPVGTVADAVVVAPDEWLRAVLGPLGPVVELGGVPHGFKSHLGHANWVRCRARAGGDESSPVRVVHVVLVVRGIEVLAIPASKIRSVSVESIIKITRSLTRGSGE